MYSANNAAAESLRILITGATGYLGSRLALNWFRAGHSVQALTRTNKPLPAGVMRVQGSDVASAIRNTDVLVHTACCYARYGEPWSEVFRANLLDPLQILEAIPRTAVFLNTDTVLPRGINSYAMSKDAFRRAGSQASLVRGVRWFNVRLEHFYGPGEAADKFVTRTARACLNDKEILFTPGEQRRDFIFVDDIISAFDMALTMARAGPGESDIHVGSGHPVRIRDLVECIHRLCGSTAELRFGAIPYREREPMDIQTSDATPIAQYGWRQTVGLKQGLEEVVRFERAGGNSLCGS